MARAQTRDLAAPALLLAGAGVVAGAAAGGIAAHRRRRRGSSVDARVVARRLLEEPWRGRLDVIDELVAPDYVGHEPAETEPLLGPAGLRASVERLLQAFPGGIVTVEEQFADGDTVVSRWTGRATHGGELAGIAPTGKEVTVSGITICRIADGLVVETWTSWDRLGLLVQLGAVASSARA